MREILLVPFYLLASITFSPQEESPWCGNVGATEGRSAKSW
ncbi:hypothetical protein AJ79_10144 [Helicocarpus griseus UAMH5409]|uniref:Uncharacterized protein n=1 Tax=Helicocarpus griseus UAMH5409 TaxID=1447875 RepID=A0A2B7WFC8_9EURO|nr:hypothetical protein AJ79_10144 [Helicocarpus griseus UAMH5409]